VILLVEDDPEVRKLAGLTLRRHGYTVLEAGLGLDGLRLAAHIPGTIHLVLSDIIMPGLSGPEFVARLSVSRPRTKVLYMTGYAAGGRHEGGIQPTAHAVLEKPFTQHMLLSQIRAVLDGSEDTLVG
jgi:CheY-like chemotaxis protein